MAGVPDRGEKETMVSGENTDRPTEAGSGGGNEESVIRAPAADAAERA